MALVRWQPFQEIDSLQREMNRLFETLTPALESTPNRWDFVPAAELHETETEVHLKLEIPGIEAKDLDVQVTADAVAICGERRTESKTEENGKVKTEFRYGKFHRVIPLPAQVQNDKVTAEYKDGILNLVLPKTEQEKNRVVKVNVA